MSTGFRTNYYNLGISKKRKEKLEQLFDVERNSEVQVINLLRKKPQALDIR